MGSLRFILGRAGSSKTTRLVEEIAALLQQEPLGEPILLLVPDQATLLYERLIACGSGRSAVGNQGSGVGNQGSGVGSQGAEIATRSNGYIRLTVITFRQLIERLLGEGGGSAIPEITPLGRRILIGRLLRRMQPELAFYQSTARQPGLAGKLDEAFAEIERSGRNLDDLLFIAGDVEAQSPQSSLPAKLRDLHRLIKEYERVLGNDRLDQHRRFTTALKAAETSPTLATTRLYVDDFYDFTSTERTLLIQIARYAQQSSIALTVDPKQVQSLIGITPDDDMLLRGSSLAFRRLHHLGMETKLPIERIVLDTLPRFESPELLHIDRQFEATRPGKLESNGEVAFIEAPSRRAEVDAAARQIQDWTKAGMRLRDMLVLARDVSAYEREIEASFREHGLAHFIDRQRPASHHPLIRTVRAILQLPLTDFRHDVVVDLIKTGLSGIETTKAEELENYLLAHRVRGTAAWAMPWAYQSRGKQEDEPDVAAREQLASVNETRERIYAGLTPMIGEDVPRPAGEWCSRICQAMDNLQVNKALADAISELEAAGKLEEAASDQAVWTEFVELLDQLCSVLSEEELTLREYVEVLNVALERFTLAITPPTIDQVLVGSVDRTRSANVKACIVLGLSEGEFPQRIEDAAALNDDDRRLLDARQFELKADSRRALMDEQTLAYLAFTRPSQKLTLIRHTTNADGRPVGPSLFWTQLSRLFKNASVTSVEKQSTFERIATAPQLAEAIIGWSQHPTEAMKDEHAITRWFATWVEPQIVSVRDALRRAITYDNASVLSRSIAEQLLASPLKMSATRLETFAACPFKHFAQYTLGLRAREEADLTRLDLGTVYHSVLENLIGDAIRTKTNLAEPIPDLAAKIRSFSEQAAGELRSEFMLTPGRNRYLLEGVRSTMEHIVETQRHAIAAGAFRPKQTEFAFGFNEKMPALQITTPSGRDVMLRGRIDRIDSWPMGDQIAASVVDYKLGDHKANFARIKHGLNLQLLTYLLVLEAMGETLIGAPVQPAAAFYVRLLRTIESVEHPDDTPDASLPETYLRKYKPRGVVDERFVDSIDPDAAMSLKPRSDPDSLNKGDVLSPQAFERLIAWTRQKIGELADKIMDGVTEVRPYRLKTLTPCSTCDYRAVCRLDLAFNRYLPILGSTADALAEIVGEEP